ncbi:MarR family transcriptional regulator [Metabacillus sp. GX 13764]|uniref:MarR family winged helix-turn-helix transcriptional regulator n=1 Tax=Metabacillus kandeliae TaxID=2900151 RepID=UPI001E294147|nr:MarR family transcriptional regulator [Metabacillus kandeliae]MCD7032811.1 MarR family transcriptional regulator [Metabacillus kandeliae]
MKGTIEKIEHEIALLSRLTAALNPKNARLDRSGYLLLSKLVTSSPQAINAMAEDLKLNVSTASRQVAALEEKGFVRRFPDSSNKRISLIDITDQGETVYRQVKKSRAEAYTEILRNWTEEDLRVLEKMLGRLTESLLDWEP